MKNALKRYGLYCDSPLRCLHKIKNWVGGIWWR